jgi:hypothetical protein
MEIVASGAHMLILNNVQGDVVTELNASSGAVVRHLGFRSVVGFTGPNSVVASVGRLWVTNDNSVIELNTSNGSVLRVLKAKVDDFESPGPMLVEGRHLWVTSDKSVAELKLSDGSLIRVFK